MKPSGSSLKLSDRQTAYFSSIAQLLQELHFEYGSVTDTALCLLWHVIVCPKSKE